MADNSSNVYRRGWRLRIGIVAPSVWDYESEYRKITPMGINLVTVTLGATTFDKDDMQEARERRATAARALDRRDVKCILAAGGPVSTLEGRKAEQEFIEAMQSELSAPFTTVLQAQVDALNTVGADSVLVVTPFPDSRDAETKAYLEESGFEVATMGGISVPDTYDTRKTPENQVYNSVMDLANETDTFDAVLVGCAPFGHVDHIAPLEEDLERPVIMSTQAQLWKSFKMSGIQPDIDGYGTLFDHG